MACNILRFLAKRQASLRTEQNGKRWNWRGWRGWRGWRWLTPDGRKNADSQLRKGGMWTSGKDGRRASTGDGRGEWIA
jgi:hypothetical protein